MNHEKISHSVTQCPVKLMIFWRGERQAGVERGYALSFDRVDTQKDGIKLGHVLGSLKLTTLQYALFCMIIKP